MFGRRGHLLNWQDIIDSGVQQHSFLKWYGIVHSIPTDWKTNVNPNDFTALQRNDDEINILFPGASYNLLQCKTNIITPKLVDKRFIPPKAKLYFNSILNEH